MGCGTGPLTASDRFKITLRFLPTIPQASPVYTNFKDAMQGLLRERFDAWNEVTSGGDVDTVELVMRGPVTPADQPLLNRAMNRLLWGIRIKCPGDDLAGNPVPSGFKVKVLSQQKNREPVRSPDWRDEGTCVATPQ